MSIKAVIQRLFTFRFELFLSSQLAILFGSLLLPYEYFQESISPILFLINILCGTLLVSRKPRMVWIIVVMFTILVLIFGSNPFIQPNWSKGVQYAELIVYFLFYIMVTQQVIWQILHMKDVNKNVIMGLISGYISLGLISFFTFLCIEVAHPGSFHGLVTDFSHTAETMDDLIYYSFITLMTIGYGDMYPISQLARKASVLVGLAGQFYMVIITAVVIEKYLGSVSKES